MLEQSEVKGILESRKQAAASFVTSEILAVREKAREFYEGKPFGNEIAGRSQFILTDVRDKIEALMPALMKVFTAGSRLVDFLPVGPEDELQAREATLGVNHVIMKENRGFSILETAFKDGLLEKVGITKTWAEEISTEKTEKRTGILGDELADLDADEKVEILEEDARDMDIGGEILTVFDVKIKISGETRWKIRIGNVVPENFIISPNAVYIEDADYVGERMEKSVSELIGMGVDQDVAEALPALDVYANNPITGAQRRDRLPTPDNTDKASRLVAVWWEHATIDIDEDGSVERWRFLRADSGDILLDEEWDDDWPYQAGAPIPKPHEFYGTSLAEEVMDIQLAKSTILREWLDNLYGLNNQRLKVFESVPGQVSMDDVLNQDLRAPIRIRSAPGGQADVVPLGNIPVGQDIFPALEYFDSVAEVRTGVSKMGQGLDPNVLHKTPATTAGFMMSLAQEKQALIARVYAETLVKDLCLSVYRLMRRYDNAARVIRLTGKFVEINPGSWPEEMDVSVNVGLGTGNKMQQASNLQQLSGYMQLGRRAGLVGQDNIYNAAKMSVEALGFVNPDLYFTDPESPKGKKLNQQAQAQQSQPDPVEMAKIKQKQSEAQAKDKRETIKIQAAMKIDQARLMLETSKVQKELGLEEAETVEKLRLKAQELIQNAQLKLLEIETEAELEGMELGMEAVLKREELAIEERLGAKKINVNTNIRDPDS
jgi:hypothetical protein